MPPRPVHRGHVVAVGAVLRLDLPVAVVGVGGGAAQDLDKAMDAGKWGKQKGGFYSFEHGHLLLWQEWGNPKAVGAVLRLDLPVAVVGVGGGAAQDLEAVRGLVDDRVDDLGVKDGRNGAYPEGFNKEGSHDLTKVARFESYRGFLFGPAVRAGVDDAVQLLILVPGDHDGGAADVGRVVVADVRDLRLVGQVDPVLQEET
jgi:hypothetical protein